MVNSFLVLLHCHSPTDTHGGGRHDDPVAGFLLSSFKEEKEKPSVYYALGGTHGRHDDLVDGFHPSACRGKNNNKKTNSWFKQNLFIYRNHKFNK